MKEPTARPRSMRATLAAPTDSLQDIIRRLDWAELEIVLVVDDDGRLIGTITDGDVRRGILAGLGLERPASAVMNTKPIAVPDGAARAEMLQIMRRFMIRHLPVLDADHRPIRLELLETVMEPDAPAQSAVIMAGGLGQRLRPLTETTPKPLLKIADQPILDHILAGLRDSGIEEVVISVNYLGEHIRRHVGNGDGHRLNVSYVNERQRLGTAGALSLLDPRPQHPFLVMNGDLLTDMNFTSLFRYQKKAQHDLVMCVRRHTVQVPYGVVELRDDRIVALREKPVYDHFINAGIYIVAPRCLDWIPRNGYFDMTDLAQCVMRQGGSVGAFPIIEYWRDIGCHEDYVKANHERLNAEAALNAPPAVASVPLEVIAS